MSETSTTGDPRPPTSAPSVFLTPTEGDMTTTATRRSGAEGVDAGVGLTALLVAAARAIETHRHDSLARDVYAEHFVRAAPACADWPVSIQEVPEGDDNPLWGRFARYFGLRTGVLDDFLHRSVGKGVRQLVLLGAGLDTRAFRLDLPSDCVVFEIDREGVLAFKEQVLTDLSAAPKAKRIPVPVDLRDDWVTALTSVGFDPAAPSVWLAEGLLFYLPGPAETYLIDTVDRLTTGAAPWPSRPSWRRTCSRTATAGSTRRRESRSASICSTSSTGDRARTPRVTWRPRAGPPRCTRPSTSPVRGDVVPSPSRTTRWRGTGGSSRTRPGPDARSRRRPHGPGTALTARSRRPRAWGWSGARPVASRDGPRRHGTLMSGRVRRPGQPPVGQPGFHPCPARSSPRCPWPTWSR